MMSNYKGTMETSDRFNILYSHRTRGEDVEGIHIKGMANAFLQLGHHVNYVAVPGATTNNVEKKLKKNEKNGGGRQSFWTFVSKFCPQLLFELMELAYNFVLYANLKKNVQKKHIDFIYERYALNTFATVWFGKKYNIPVILEVNDATGIRRVRRHKAEFLAQRIESWVFRNCDAIVTISSEFKRILCQRGVSEEKVSFLPNAVDPLVFDPFRYDDKVRSQLKLKGKTIIGFIGSFAKWHGVDMLLRVMPDVIKKIPNVYFLMVGSGVCLQDVKDKIKNSGLIEKVIFTGKVSSEDVPCYLKAMDIGVIPDSNQYGSPMKLFEYMTMKVVPVVPKLPPILDVIQDEVTGFVFDRKNVQSLKEQLIHACENKDLRKQIGKNAREQVLEKHLWIHNARSVLNLYNRIKTFS